MLLPSDDEMHLIEGVVHLGFNLLIQGLIRYIIKGMQQELLNGGLYLIIGVRDE